MIYSNGISKTDAKDEKKKQRYTYMYLYHSVLSTTACIATAVT